MNRLLRPLCLAAVLAGSALAAADQPAPERLPAPRQAPPALPAPLVWAPAPSLLPLVPAYPPPQPSVLPEFGRMSIWQAYAPDRTGRMRPVVITTPHGAYFRLDHSPFPWTSTRYLEYMPYVVD